MQDDEIVDDDFEMGDEFDDEFDIDDDSDITINESPLIGAQQQKKTLLQKFFIPIVVVIIGVFGLLFAASQGLFSQGQPAPEIIQQSSTTNASSDQAAATKSQPTAQNVDVIPQEKEAPLTPLLDEQTAENIELADLEAELQQDNMLVDNSVQLDELSSIDIEDTDSLSSLDSLSTIDNLADNTMDVLSEPILEEPNENILESVDSDEITDALDTPVEAEALEITNASEINSESLESSLSEVLPDNSAAWEEEKLALQEELQSKELLITELELKIAALEKASEEKKSEVIVAPAEEPNPKENAQPTNEPIATPVAVQKKRPVTWTLRSAQPGKATVFSANTNDLKNVEVGNKLPGIGRIISIQVENGLWVVRGTNGRISQ